MKNFITKILIIFGIVSFLGIIPNTFICESYAKKTPDGNEIENPELFSGYMRRLQKKIKSNWIPPKQEASTGVVVLFKIQRNGKMSSYKIIKSSGNISMDRAAIFALKKSAPFEALPEEFVGNEIDIQFTFDYNVFKDGEKI